MEGARQKCTLYKKAFKRVFEGFFIGDPAGIRTQDHYIKSVMLYQLSYGIKVLF
jgi:hypothetical protein